MNILFGPGHQLRPFKDQQVQYAAEKLVDLITSKAAFNDVKVLGPERNQTQVEISLTDALQLGLTISINVLLAKYLSILTYTI